MKNFNYIQTSNFLLRIGATAEDVYKNKLRINTLINIGNKLYNLSHEEPEIIANHLKMIFIQLNHPVVQNDLINLGYDILTKRGDLRSFWSIIFNINRKGIHPKLIFIFGPRVWDTIKYLFKHK